MPFVKPHRDYYKYGTELNASIVGNFARLDKGVASGFSAGNYLTLPNTFKPEGNSWEICFKVHTPSSHADEAIFSKYTSDTYYGLRLELTTSGKIYYIVSATSGAKYLFEGTGTNTIPTDTDVLIKFQFTGTKYVGQISNDNGETWITDKEYDSTTKMYDWNSASTIGYFAGKGTHFKGSIDLSQSYININGERWWSGDSYTKVGSWIDNGVVGSFTSANYLTLPETLPSSITSSEYVFKITTGASVTSPENQIIYAHQSPNTGNIVIRGSKFHLFTGNWNAGVTTVLPNTTYILKSVFDGSNWILYSSTDNIDWTQEATWSTTNNYAGTNLYIGRDYDTTGEYFSGSIDLTQSYIKINGKEWWHGTKAVIVPSSSITDFGKTKYYKNIVTTKYWKEITTGSRELEYACYFNYDMYIYAKVPLGSDMAQYYDGSNYAQVYNISDLKKNTTASNNYYSIDETVATGYMGLTYPRFSAGDLYIDTTVTETVEGTPEDYTYTTEETETIEVTANDEYDYTEFVPSTQFDYHVDSNKLYQLTAIERTYYKYVWENWTQPVLTSNTSYGVLTASEEGTGRAAWQALDGNTSTNWEIGTATTGWVNWKLPKKIKITGMKIRSRTGDRPNLTCRCYTDSSKTTAIGDSITTTATGQEVVVANIPVEGIITDNIYFDCTSTQDYLGISDVVITAQEQIGFELNVNGSDIYQDFVQPLLTANGTLGGDKFAVYCAKASSSYPIYKAFDGSSSNFTDIAHPDSNVVIYNPKPLKVTTIKIANRSDVEVTAVTGYTIYGSNDNSSWEELVSGTNDITSKGSVWDIDLSSNTKSFKYYKIDITSAYISTGTYQIAEITLIAQELKAIGGTVEDADYHTDKVITHSPMTSETKYYKYAYQDWKQPVLTENGTMGGDSFAVSASSYQSTGSFEPWKAFDNISEYEDYNAWLSGTTTMPVYFVFYNPKPLKVKKLSIKNFAHRNNPNYIIGSGEVLGSNDNAEWTLLKTFTNTTGGGGEIWDIDLSSNEQGFKYYKINITSSLNTNGDVGIGELTITAQEQISVESTSSDYDWYKRQETKMY